MVERIILLIITIIAFVISILQFAEKGFLFNNAYLWASKEEQARMDKKPYYRQSGVVFLLVGTLFLLDALGTLLKMDWTLPAIIVVAIGTVIYAVVSFVMIEKLK